MQNETRVLFLGDVIGKPGRKAVLQYIQTVEADFKIINGENLAGGIGITPRVAEEMLESGVDLITTGNHVWKKREMLPFIMGEQRVIRPLNYPPGTPGFGFAQLKKSGKVLWLTNVEGRVFMNSLECPFRAMEDFLSQVEPQGPVIVDFHAEATSEKIAMGWFLDGKVTAVIGTHTHVQTADERILPKGTGYITDAGMTGPSDSVIGMDKRAVLKRFVTQMPQKYEVGKEDVEAQGVLVTIDVATNICVGIRRIKERVS